MDNGQDVISRKNHCEKADLDLTQQLTTPQGCHYTILYYIMLSYKFNDRISAFLYIT